MDEHKLNCRIYNGREEFMKHLDEVAKFYKERDCKKDGWSMFQQAFLIALGIIAILVFAMIAPNGPV